jgi:hypothetical protein
MLAFQASGTGSIPVRCIFFNARHMDALLPDVPCVYNVVSRAVPSAIVPYP